MTTLIVVNYQMDVDGFIEKETTKENGLECIKYELNRSELDKTSDIFRVVSMIGSFDIIFISYTYNELVRLIEYHNIPFIVIYPKSYKEIIEVAEEIFNNSKKQSNIKYIEISENEIIDRNLMIEWKNKIGVEEFNVPTYNVYIKSVVSTTLIGTDVTKEKAEEICKSINEIYKDSNKVRAYYSEIKWRI